MTDASIPRFSRNLVFICDGTLSSMAPGEESNAGLVHRILTEQGRSGAQIFKYDRGVQATGWRKWLAAASGEVGTLGASHGLCAERTSGGSDFAPRPGRHSGSGTPAGQSAQWRL